MDLNERSCVKIKEYFSEISKCDLCENCLNWVILNMGDKPLIANCIHEGPCLIYNGTSGCDMSILNVLCDEFGFGIYVINGREYEVCHGLKTK
jgi:hypothetical protein